MSAFTFGPLAKLDRVEYLVVHTYGPLDERGRPVNLDQSAQSVHAHHLRLGTSGYGYHAGIRMDGTLEEGRPEDRAGAHVKGLNGRSLGIACAGNGDVADFTPAQYATLLPWLAERAQKYAVPVARILGHRECNGIPGVDRITKTCPGVHVSMDRIRERVAALLPGGATSRVGERVYSPYFGEYLIVTEYKSDREWSFVPESRLKGASVRANTPLSQMPRRPS